MSLRACGEAASDQGSTGIYDSPGKLLDGEYYGWLASWDTETMTIELLEYAGRSSQSWNYLFNQTGQIRTLDISQAAICLEYAWTYETEVQYDTIDIALDTEIPGWGGTTLRESCTMNISFVVKDSAVRKIVFLYAA